MTIRNWKTIGDNWLTEMNEKQFDFKKEHQDRFVSIFKLYVVG